MDTAIWVVIISSIFAGFGWIYKNEKEKRHEVEKQLSEKKYAVYTSIIQLFIDIVNSARLNVQLLPEETEEKILNIIKDLIIYGSDSVLKKFSQYRQNADPKEPYKNLILYYDMMLAIRKDMGHPNTEAGLDDLLGNFIKDYKETKEELLKIVLIN